MKAVNLARRKKGKTEYLDNNETTINITSLGSYRESPKFSLKIKEKKEFAGNLTITRVSVVCCSF